MEGTTNVVFGTGMSLQNNWQLLIKHFKPKYFSDNAAKKWHTYPMSQFSMGNKIECIPPEQIKELQNPFVVIAIGDPYAAQEVKNQLDAMHISCGIIGDYLEEWTREEPLPDHLQILAATQGEKRILLCNSPEHDNVGDHLISVAEIQFLKKYFPDFICVEITDIEYLWFHKKIRKYIQQKDIILITGGGFLGSMWLYNGELNVRNILQEYPQNKVVIMPQTCFFEENERGKEERTKTAEIYGGHENLTVVLREKNSFRLMREFFGGEEKIALIPDMALSLNYSRKQRERKGALLCLRRDKESVLKKEQVEEILTYMHCCGLEYEYTLMHTGRCYDMEKREEEIEKKMEQMKAVKLVVTDTLHAMILCTITGTPCLAYDNISHKVSGVYEWIASIPYIHLYQQEENVQDCISHLIEQGAGLYDEEPLEVFYRKLAQIIGEERWQGRKN